MAGRLALFYHIWAPEGPHPWTLLFDEQIKRIYNSGLADHADIYCGIAGPAFEPIARLVSLYDFAQIIAKSDSFVVVTMYHTKRLSL
jgi:hypothetical protein